MIESVNAFSYSLIAVSVVLPVVLVFPLVLLHYGQGEILGDVVKISLGFIAGIGGGTFLKRGRRTVLCDPKATQVSNNSGLSTFSPTGKMPIVLVQNGFLYFSDIRRSQTLRWVPGKGVEIVRNDTNQGNGLTLDLSGRLITCEGAARCVTLTEADGTVTILAEEWKGKQLNWPNDVIGHSNGSLYFTDPEPKDRLLTEQLEIGFGGVFRIDSNGNIHLATDECEYPNGLAFSPDESILYVAISFLDDGCRREAERNEICTHRRIRAFDVKPDGTLSNNRIFADMSSAEIGVPDGMKVDVQGRVFCTGNGGTCIFDDAGRHLGTIRTPEVPANCAFGGPDQRTLFLTARTSLYIVQVKEPGIKVPRA